MQDDIDLLLPWQASLQNLGVHFAPPPLPTCLLRRGSRGPAVRQLQRALRNLGYLLETDGLFGPMTESCVLSFQGTHGIPHSGCTTPATWAALGGAAYA